MALPYDPLHRGGIWVGPLQRIQIEEHDVSASAAVVAVDLISSARLAAKLDSVYTEYSAQYLVDNASRGTDRELNVKTCLEFALKQGVPKAEDWMSLGSVWKLPSSYKPALVSMKGEVIEAENMTETDDWSWDQPAGAKLHVFTPHIDLQREGIYCGSSGDESHYVGLRDGLIIGVEKLNEKDIATMKLWYKNEFRVIKVAMSRWFIYAILDHAYVPLDSQAMEPTYLIVDLCFPRLSLE